MKSKFDTQTIHAFVSEPHFDPEVLLRKDAAFPKITVVTPSYNQAQFLERTILSVLNQNYPNLEYFVMDGGSTDGSIEIIHKYAEYLAAWVSEKDNGQAAAINRGLRRATGDLLAWQNSDDIYLPGAFFRVARMDRENPDRDLIYANILEIDEEEEILREHHFVPPAFNSMFVELFAQQGAFLRRKVFNEFGLLDETLYNSLDAEYYMRISHGVHPLFAQEFWGAYRSYAQNKSNRAMQRMYGEYHSIFERYHIDYRSFGLRMVRLLYACRRILWLLLNGDVAYLIHGAARRIRQVSGMEARRH